MLSLAVLSFVNSGVTMHIATKHNVSFSHHNKWGGFIFVLFVSFLSLYLWPFCVGYHSRAMPWPLEDARKRHHARTSALPATTNERGALKNTAVLRNV